MGRSQRKDATKNAKGGLILDTDDLTIDGKTIYRNLHGKYLVELQEKKRKRKRAANQVLSLEGGSQVDA